MKVPRVPVTAVARLSVVLRDLVQGYSCLCPIRAPLQRVRLTIIIG